MKNIIKILFLAVVTVSCSSNDDHTTESCLNPDLGITAEFSNPYPDHLPGWDYYYDWKWTMKNDSTLCISFEKVESFPEDAPYFYKSFFYYSIDTKTNCATLVNAKGSALLSGNLDENGYPIYYVGNGFDKVTLSELQDFDITDKIVGKNILTADNGNQETLQFWIEFTEENHFELNPLELNSGL